MYLFIINTYFETSVTISFCLLTRIYSINNYFLITLNKHILIYFLNKHSQIASEFNLILLEKFTLLIVSLHNIFSSFNKFVCAVSNVLNNMTVNLEFYVASLFLQIYLLWPPLIS